MRSIRPIPFALLLAACLAGAPLAARAATADRCVPAASVVTPTAALPQVKAALQPGGTLKILAIGSGTLTGPDVGAIANSYPYQMAQALQQASPGATVHLTVRGGKGMPAAEMVPLMKQALAEGGFQLVLWQTGTVEAVHATPPDAFAHTLANGEDITRAAGADLVLVDAQYSRMLTNKVNLGPYEDAFRDLSAKAGVLLFRRYDLMRDWAEHGNIDLEKAGKAQRETTALALHNCLGDSLASLILAAARK